MPIAIGASPSSPRMQIEAAAHIDCGDDAAAQIEHAGDLRAGERYARDPGGPEHFLHALDRQAENLARRS